MSVSDGSASDHDTFTWTVNAANTAPVVDSVAITPASPRTNDTLTANVTSHDADGDALTTHYQWTRNGTDISGATGGTLNLATAGNGDKGDLIRVRVTADDGDATSAPVTSSPVTVQNTPPLFSTNLQDRTDTEGAAVSLDADASDADADGLTYGATGLPAGVSIAPSTGVISGTLAAGSAGSYNVSVTVTDGSATDTDTFTWTVNPAAATVFATDTFTRSLSNSWGSASTGGAYTLQGTAADYDVTGSIGTIALGTAGTNRSAVLASVSARDLDLSFRAATDKTAVGTSEWVYGLARRVSSTTEYRAMLRLAPGGGVFVQASAVVNGTETGIGSEVRVTSLTHTAGSFIRVRAQFSGINPTTIRIRAWADGTTEPTTWNYTGTNSAATLQVAGGVGLRAYLGGAATNAPVLVSLDDLRAASLGGANTAPVVDSVSITPASPTTAQLLTANVTSHDPDGDSLTTSYQWTRNGTDIGGATGATLNLATAGNGDKGDLIRVRATVSDGTASSAPVTSAPVTVQNTAPTASVLLSPASPDSNATLTATVTRARRRRRRRRPALRLEGQRHDPSHDRHDATTDTFDLSQAGNGDAGDTVSVEVTPNDGTIDGTRRAPRPPSPAPSRVFASDPFSRTLANSWGSAVTGGAYTLQGTAADYDVTGSGRHDRARDGRRRTGRRCWPRSRPATSTSRSGWPPTRSRRAARCGSTAWPAG